MIKGDDNIHTAIEKIASGRSLAMRSRKFLKNVWGGRTRALRKEHQQAVALQEELGLKEFKLRKAEGKILWKINNSKPVATKEHLLAKKARIDQWHKAREKTERARNTFQRQSDKGIDMEEPLEAAVKATRKARIQAGIGAGIGVGSTTAGGAYLYKKRRKQK